MAETLFEELKRYVQWSSADEQALRSLYALAAPHFTGIARAFYDRLLAHEGAKKVLTGGGAQAERLVVTLVAWMDSMLQGPWDEAYFERRARIGRMHVRIGLPQHYMFGAMNVIRQEMNGIVDQHFREDPTGLRERRTALGKILDLELAIMLHTYREDLLSQQARTERLSTFGQLVGSIGHELRNPLAVIETSLFLVRTRVGSDERVLKHVNRIGEQVAIANDIVTQLLDMIRDRPLAREPVDVSRVVADSEQAVPRPEAVRVGVELPALPPVLGDAGQLRQVFVNLLQNAVQAVGERGFVRVSGGLVDGRIAVAVEDSGPGVDPEVQNRLFEPLVTTRAKGIGLGLALVKRIVERHGGSIGYEPRQGSGARFVVRLPPA